MNDQVVATFGIYEVGTSVESSLQKIGHQVLVKLLGFHFICGYEDSSAPL
jgi:hypothetical protein